MAWKLLTESDYGLGSLAVITVTLVIGVAYYMYFNKKMNEGGK